MDKYRLLNELCYKVEHYPKYQKDDTGRTLFYLGSYENVLLNVNEYMALGVMFPSDREERIEKLSIESGFGNIFDNAMEEFINQFHEEHSNK